MRGRKPKPTEVKKRAGNPGKRPLNLSEPSAGKKPKKPKDLSKSTSLFWDELEETLSKMGVLDGADSREMELICIQWEAMKDCQELIAKEGRVLKGTERNGERKLTTNPAVRQLNESTRQLRMLLADFGLNPTARVALGSKTKDKPSKLAQLLSTVGKN